MADPCVDIRVVSYRDLDLDSVHDVRQRAWQDKYPSFAAHIAAWEDGFEKTATHFLAERHGFPVGVARFNRSDTSDMKAQFAHAGQFFEFIQSLRPPVGVISRLSVAPDARGLGVARALDKARIAAAIKAGCSAIVCEVKVGAKRKGALKALGFRTIAGISAYPAYPFPHVQEAPERLCEPLCLQLDEMPKLN